MRNEDIRNQTKLQRMDLIIKERRLRLREHVNDDVVVSYSAFDVKLAVGDRLFQRFITRSVQKIFRHTTFTSLSLTTLVKTFERRGASSWNRGCLMLSLDYTVIRDLLRFVLA